MWRSIDGFINYQVSNIGNVRNANNGKLLHLRQHHRVYLNVEIRADEKQKNAIFIDS